MVKVKVKTKEIDGKKYVQVYLVVRHHQEDKVFAVAPLSCSTFRAKRYFYDLMLKRCDE